MRSLSVFVSEENGITEERFYRSLSDNDSYVLAFGRQCCLAVGKSWRGGAHWQGVWSKAELSRVRLITARGGGKRLSVSQGSLGWNLSFFLGTEKY